MRFKVDGMAIGSPCSFFDVFLTHRVIRVGVIFWRLWKATGRPRKDNEPGSKCWFPFKNSFYRCPHKGLHEPADVNWSGSVGQTNEEGQVRDILDRRSEHDKHATCYVTWVFGLF